MSLFKRKHRGPHDCERRCPATSGTFVGYRCDLKCGHDGRHKATTSVTTEDSAIWGSHEITRSETTW